MNDIIYDVYANDKISTPEQKKNINNLNAAFKKCCGNHCSCKNLLTHIQANKHLLTSDVCLNILNHYSSNPRNYGMLYCEKCNYFGNMINNTNYKITFNFAQFLINITNTNIMYDLLHKQQSLGNFFVNENCLYNCKIFEPYNNNMYTYRHTIKNDTTLINYIFEKNIINIIKNIPKCINLFDYLWSYITNNIYKKKTITNEVITYIFSINNKKLNNVHLTNDFHDDIIRIFKNIDLNDDNIYKLICNVTNCDTLYRILLHFIYENKLIMFEKIITKIDVENINLIKIFEKINGNVNEYINKFIDVVLNMNIKITKEFVIHLLNFKIKIDNFEKHNIVIDNEIMQKCCDVNFYPYILTIPPQESILIIECSRDVPNKKSTLIKNFNTYAIEKLTNFKKIGANFTQKCLDVACNTFNNYEIIKFLINVCNLIINKSCIELYENCNYITGLGDVMNNYCKNFPEDINILKKNEIKITLNENELLKIPKNNKNNIIDKTHNYKINSKIIKILKCNSNIMLYDKIYELILKYLIANNLVIGQYFIINSFFEEILNINKSTILHIDQLDNILSYIIKK